MSASEFDTSFYSPDGAFSQKFPDLSAADPPVASYDRNTVRPLFHEILIDHLRDGVIFIDSQCRITCWSQSVEIMTGMSSSKMTGRCLAPSLINLSDSRGSEIPDDECPFSECIRTGKLKKELFGVRGRSGREVKAEMHMVPVITSDKIVVGAVIMMRDSSVQLDLERQLNDLYAMSVLDPLTQVANRAEFERVLDECVCNFRNLARSQDEQDRPSCSIIICDIDFFKQINDNYGHHIGDQALTAFAQLLKQFVRANDLVARYGGEEFVILCANCDITSAVQRAEQIRTTLTKTPQQMLNGKCINASFGVSQLTDADTATDFFVRADKALLQAKQLGRNRVVEAKLNVDEAPKFAAAESSSLSGVRWREMPGNLLYCEEFAVTTPRPVLVEKLRGYIGEVDAKIRQVEPDYVSIFVSVADRNSSGREEQFGVDVELQERSAESTTESGNRHHTFIRISIRPPRRRLFRATNSYLYHNVLNELRRYLMINDDAAKLKVAPAADKSAPR